MGLLCKAVQDSCTQQHARLLGQNLWQLHERLFTVGADQGAKLRVWRCSNKLTVQ